MPFTIVVGYNLLKNLYKHTQPVVRLPDGIAFGREATHPELLWAEIDEINPLAVSFTMMRVEFISRKLTVPVDTILHESDYFRIERDWVASNPQAHVKPLRSTVLGIVQKNAYESR